MDHLLQVIGFQTIMLLKLVLLIQLLEQLLSIYKITQTVQHIKLMWHDQTILAGRRLIVMLVYGAALQQLTKSISKMEALPIMVRVQPLHFTE